jgi:hypothetical protein
VSRMTLFRAERGEAAVSLGTYIRIMEVLRLDGDLELLAKDDALGHRIEAATRPSSPAAVPAQPTAPAISFSSAEEMSHHQRDRELAEALRVRALGPAAYSKWLESSWGKLQKEANRLYAGVPRPGAGRAWHFETPADKNRFDREREIEFAVQVARQMQAAQQAGACVA